mgnify:CR=1 FL=1
MASGQVREIAANGSELGVGIGQPVEFIAKAFAPRQTVGIPADVLAGTAHAALFAIEAVVVVQVFGENVAGFLYGRHGQVLAGAELPDWVAGQAGNGVDPLVGLTFLDEAVIVLSRSGGSARGGASGVRRAD